MRRFQPVLLAVSLAVLLGFGSAGCKRDPAPEPEPDDPAQTQAINPDDVPDEQEPDALPGYTRRVRARYMASCPTECQENLRAHYENADNSQFCLQSYECSYNEISRNIAIEDFSRFGQGEGQIELSEIFEECARQHMDILQTE